MRKNFRKFPHYSYRAFPATIVCSLTIMLPSLENTKVHSTSNQLTFKRSTVMGTESLATGKSRLGRGRNETKKGVDGERPTLPDSPAHNGLHTINSENISFTRTGAKKSLSMAQKRRIPLPESRIDRGGPGDIRRITYPEKILSSYLLLTNKKESLLLNSSG